MCLNITNAKRKNYLKSKIGPISKYIGFATEIIFSEIY